jgi:3'-phosphoadenosine 5'-phosphosulfate sulfotransferase (PAPS reductase)/FAD synthetase
LGVNPHVDQDAPIVIEGATPSAEIREQLAREGRPVLLAFSRGKDSIAAWLALREARVEVRPFHLYLVPGLRFVDESLAFYEDYFDTAIPQLPHPSLYRWLNTLLFTPPERRVVIEAAQLPELDYLDISRALCEEHYDLDPEATYTADGVRAADSPNRRTAIKFHGAVRESVLKVSPVWDWRIKHVRSALAEHNCPLPIDYEWFNRTFDGLDIRFLKPIKENAPDDYERILEWFPLADLELFRATLF